MALLKGNSTSVISQNVRDLKNTGKYSEAQCVSIAMKHSKKGMGKKIASIQTKMTKGLGK